MSIQSDVPQEPPAPEILLELLLGSVQSPLLKLPILRAGVELQIWDKIAKGHRTTNEIASVLRADTGGVRRLLDALTVMNLLEKANGIYSLPEWAEYYLLPDKPTYFGSFILEWLAWEGHGQLANAIRTGRHPINPDVTREELVSHFIPFYAYRTLAPHRSLQRYDGYWQTLHVQPRGGLQVLDLACGAGIATLALAIQHSGVRVILQDWPAMLEIAYSVAQKLGLEQQITLLPGDMFSVNYDQGKYDIARLGFVTYLFGPDDLVRLFRRIYSTLKVGGMLVIEAPLSDDGHCKNEEAVLDGPWLFAVSAKGDVYSFSDYKGFLKQAGFDNVSKVKDDLIKVVL